jgi:predicted ATPase
MKPQHDRLQKVLIKKFKRISEADFELETLNILVGGNNSGKSSIIQSVHFAVGLLQTIALSEKMASSSGSLSTSLNPAHLIYSPSEEVSSLGYGGKLFEDEDQAISLEFTLSSGEACSVKVRKGRNRNILVAIQNVAVAKRLSSLERPFSIFSPGLAGIAKREQYVSDGVLLRTLARGDANLVLRNILLRLWGTELWQGFMTDLHDVFPSVQLSVAFKSTTDETIDVSLDVESGSIPLEIAGTGLLQAIQILAYIHRFSPTLVVLDEPDSHLHPNNQRLLCALLRKVAEERGIQIIITTHSRHVVDALVASAGFFWVRNGTVDRASRDDEIGVLLDIGALDVKERVGQPNASTIVLTEDEITQPIEIILKSSGFDLERTVVLPYYGVTLIKHLRPLVNIIRGVNPNAQIIVHRDRDFLSETEAEEWRKSIRALRVEPFLTLARDIESYFIDPGHLSKLNSALSSEEFGDLIRDVGLKIQTATVGDYVNGRIEILRREGLGAKVNPGAIAIDAQERVSKDIGTYLGKVALRALRAEFQTLKGMNLVVFGANKELSDATLSSLAAKAAKAKGAAAKKA